MGLHASKPLNNSKSNQENIQHPWRYETFQNSNLRSNLTKNKQDYVINDAIGIIENFNIENTEQSQSKKQKKQKRKESTQNLETIQKSKVQKLPQQQVRIQKQRSKSRTIQELDFNYITGIKSKTFLTNQFPKRKSRSSNKENKQEMNLIQKQIKNTKQKKKEKLRSKIKQIRANRTQFCTDISKSLQGKTKIFHHQKKLKQNKLVQTDTLDFNDLSFGNTNEWRGKFDSEGFKSQQQKLKGFTDEWFKNTGEKPLHCIQKSQIRPSPIEPCLSQRQNTKMENLLHF